MTKKSLSIALLFMPILGWCLYLTHFWVNIPFFDDFPALLEAQIIWIDHPTWQDKINIIFSQYNEHRIIFDRLVTASLYELTGQINLRLLIAIGNGMFLGIIFIFWKAGKNQFSPNSYFGFLPILLLLLQPATHENAFWAMAALQNYGVLFFVTWCLYALNGHWRWAMMAGILASATSGNGLFVWPIALIILSLQKKWLQVSCAAGLFGLILWLYFKGYVRPSHNPGITEALKEPGRVVQNFFGFLGGGLDFSMSQQLTGAFVAGISIFLGIVYFIFFYKVKFVISSHFFSSLYDKLTQLNKLQLFSLGLFLWILMTAAAVALNRAPVHEDYEVALSSRYKMYSLMALCLLYLNFYTHLSRLYKNSIIIFCILINFIFYIQYTPAVAERSAKLWAGTYNFKFNQVGLPYYLQEAAQQVLHKAQGLGVYQIPNEFVEKVQPHLMKKNNPDSTLIFGIKKTLYPYKILRLDWPQHTGLDEVFFLLKSNKTSFIFNQKYNQNPMKALFTTGRLLRTDTWAEIPFQIIPQGTYQLGVLEMQEQPRVRWSEQTINIEP
jgi:hypothetical protein